MVVESKKRPLEILLVEDSISDAELTLECLRNGNVSHQVKVLTDGQEALGYLRRNGKYKDATRPDVLLLDLNLPRKDGREVLSEIRSDNQLKTIPVLVLTSSMEQSDVLLSYLGADGFINKPVELVQFNRAISELEL